jgi:hypothetical protein
MATRALTSPTFSPTSIADAAALLDNQHMSLQGSGALDRLEVSEIYLGGQAAASSPMLMVFARHSTFGLTPTLGTNGKDAAHQDPNVAGTARGYMSAATDPQRSTTLGLLSLTFNAFGGVVKWFAQGKPISIIGNTASLGEAGLSQFTGGTTAAIGGHIIYEAV